MPTNRIKTKSGFDLVPAIKIDPEQFDWKAVLKTELIWLRENKIISGLNESDLNLIIQVATRGTAGYNRKIIWGKSLTTGKHVWLPYDKQIIHS